MEKSQLLAPPTDAEIRKFLEELAPFANREHGVTYALNGFIYTRILAALGRTIEGIAEREVA